MKGYAGEVVWGETHDIGLKALRYIGPKALQWSQGRPYRVRLISGLFFVEHVLFAGFRASRHPCSYIGGFNKKGLLFRVPILRIMVLWGLY